MEYTHGPWKAFRANSSVCVRANESIQRIEDIENHMHIEVFGENKIINAKLISATPDLYEALKAIPIDKIPSQLRLQVRNAITKAEN